MQLSIDTEPTDDGAVVKLAGDLDMLSAPDLSDTLNELLESGARKVVVDMSDLAFMDSSGLSAILGAHQTAEKHDAALTLFGPNERVIRLVNITGLGDVFEIRGNPEQPASGGQ
ncbi:MAG TPA: STAS domain-containing protein [Marmoricola sp.]|jgi:anti-sigma B factor antagonist|nr:STAS domain-containing protein [Marmoricola sp.]